MADKFKTKFFIKTAGRYLHVWFLMCRNSFLVYLNNKTILTIFLLAKILRFTFFVLFLIFLTTGSNGLAGFTREQTVFFFITFNIVDAITQCLFREVYRFRSYVVNGDLDLILVKPMNPLFRVLFGGADLIDLITIPPLLYFAYVIGVNIAVGYVEIFFYVILVISGVVISTSFYIFVLGLAIITLEIDHSVMIFRDLVKMGSIPIDVYREPLRFVLNYILPVGIMVSLPVKVLTGFIGFPVFFISFIISMSFFYISLKFWKFALKKYQSASS